MTRVLRTCAEQSWRVRDLRSSRSQTRRQLGRTCAEHHLRLVMLGHSLLPAEKRRVWAEVREHCAIPILELHKESGPELMEPAFFHQSLAPDDFLRAVIRIL